jgi:ribonuclease R
VGEKGVDVLSILRSYGFNEYFSREVEEEAGKMPQAISEEETKGRRDLRGWNIFTIDGADTKDIDDAVSIKKLNNGHYQLGVHIADVSYYVKQGSLLDQEAYKRGTSVYMVDRVAPMLPRPLSNGICSLNPGVDRLAMSVLMEIDGQGNVVNHEIFKSVIRSREQMTYENLYKILEEDDAALKDRYRELLDDFYHMKDLALILRQKRQARGAIDFDIPEPKVIIDEKGKPIDIIKYEITIANRIIEEFMLVCNETVSEHFYWLEAPFMYRIHETPDSEKISHFAEFVQVLGYRLKGLKNLHPKSLQELLDKVKGKKEERVISTIMLRSLQKARYSEKSDVHFGLAAKYYCHFTSPIRRYPDLTIHRIISHAIAGKLDDNKKEQYNKFLKEAAHHCSERERAAEMAERDSVKVKMAEYMSHRIGEKFKGVISGIASFGMFVELDNLVEGLVRVSTMYDDYYYFDEKNFSFLGERTGKMYKIGDEVEIIVVNSDLSSRTIEFELALGYNN